MLVRISLFGEAQRSLPTLPRGGESEPPRGRIECKRGIFGVRNWMTARSGSLLIELEPCTWLRTMVLIRLISVVAR